MPRLMATADYVDKFHAICTVCSPAYVTQRIINGEPAYYDDPVLFVVGNADGVGDTASGERRVMMSSSVSGASMARRHAGESESRRLMRRLLQRQRYVPQVRAAICVEYKSSFDGTIRHSTTVAFLRGCRIPESSSSTDRIVDEPLKRGDLRLCHWERARYLFRPLLDRRRIFAGPASIGVRRMFGPPDSEISRTG